LSLSVQHTGYGTTSGITRESNTTYEIGPAADYFVIDNLSVGAAVKFGRISVGHLKKDVIPLEPRIGYHVSLLPEKLGIWPRASFFYEQGTLKMTGSPDITGKALRLGLFVPLFNHPVEHFHIGIGPYINTALSTKEESVDAPKATKIGLRTEIAGWWKL